MSIPRSSRGRPISAKTLAGASRSNQTFSSAVDDFEVQDTSGLTDADRAEINKLRKTYKRGGRKAVGLALEKLAKDPIRFVVVIGALYPDMMREMIRDQMAEAGITEQDLRELIQKLESTPGTKH
jgi:hypothetical protein